MKSRYVMSVLMLASFMLGGNAQAVNQPEITGAEVGNYANKSPQFVPVQIESKADLSKYKVQDQGNNITLEQENIKVEIPKNIVEPVVLKGKDLANTKAGKKVEDIKITMPQAKGSKVTKEKNGVVGYESKDNFTNIVEPTKDGIRLMTVIENKNAPERYEYKLDIKGGYVLTESYNQDGKKGIAVLKADQSDLIAMIDTAWAKDGSGKDIETYYEIKGQTIVQVVKHKVKGTVYPVTADPYVYGNYVEVYFTNGKGATIWFNKNYTWWIFAIGRINIDVLAGVVATVSTGGISSAVAVTFAHALASTYISYYIDRGYCIAGTHRNYRTSIFYYQGSYCR